MQASAAPKFDFAPQMGSGGLLQQAGSPVRCLVVSGGAFDAAHVAGFGAQSRFRLTVDQAASLPDAETKLAGGAVDVLVLDASLADGDGASDMTGLASAAQSMAVASIVLSAEPSDEAARHAVRWGASDYLAHDDFAPGRFDEAIERALARSAALPEDQTAQLSNLRAENEALRRTSLRNMRLLKAQVLPVLAHAWRSMSENAEAGDRVDQAPKLATLTRNIVGLIDDTVVSAAAFRINEHPIGVDLNEVLSDIIHDQSNGLSVCSAQIRVEAMPVLRARRSHMVMLFEELLLGAVRAAPLGQVPELHLRAGRDADGNPILVLKEHGLHLSARKQTLTRRNGELSDAPADLTQDPHAWSLCQRLVQKNDGEMRISELPEGGCRVQIRFPKAMLLGQKRFSAPPPAAMSATTVREEASDQTGSKIA